MSITATSPVFVGNPTAQYVLVPASAITQGHQAKSENALTLAQPFQTVQREAPQAGPYGARNYGVQNYLPIGETRQLTPNEEAKVKKGLSQWLPRLGAGYSTPMWQLLASPAKASIISGTLLSLFGALYGAALKSPGAVAFGAGLGAALGSFAGFLSRRQKNENIIDLMRRLPEGATKRDMLSDPVYQSDLNRRASQSSASGDLFTSVLLASTLNRPTATYRPSYTSSRNVNFRRPTGPIIEVD